MHRSPVVLTIAAALLSGLARLPAQTNANQQQPVSAEPFSPLIVNAPSDSPPPRPKPEDWTELALDKSNLPLYANGGPVLSKIEGDGFVRELVQLRWRASDPIDVYVVRPKGVKNPPVILYLYDFTSDTDRFRDGDWCKRATKDGFAAVGFVSAVSGQRLHMPRPMKQWFVSELQEALAASAHDVQMILNYLETRGDLDLKSVGMFGQASGGSIAILAASVDARIKAVDVLNPWGDWPDWLKSSAQVPEEERAHYLTHEFLAKVANLDPVKCLPQLQSRKVRVEQTMDDPVTPQAARDKIMAAVPRPDDMVRFDDMSGFAGAYQVNGLTGWLRAQLRPTSATSTVDPLRSRF